MLGSLLNVWIVSCALIEEARALIERFELLHYGQQLNFDADREIGVLKTINNKLDADLWR